MQDAGRCALLCPGLCSMGWKRVQRGPRYWEAAAPCSTAWGLDVEGISGVSAPSMLSPWAALNPLSQLLHHLAVPSLS